MSGRAYLPLNDLPDADRHALVLSVRVLVYNRARPYKLTVGSLWRDIVGAGFYGAVTASRHFDPDRKLMFTTYADRWIRASMQRECARVRAKGFARTPVLRDKAFTVPEADDATHPAGFVFSRGIDPADEAAGRIDWGDMMARLPERYRRFAELRWRDDCSQSEIAERWGTSRQRISQIEKCIIGKLREVIKP